MQIATPDLFVSDVVRAYHNSGLQTMYGVWPPPTLKRKTFSVHATEPSNTLLPSELVLEISDGRRFVVEQPATYEERPGEFGLSWTQVYGRAALRTSDGLKASIPFIEDSPEPVDPPLPGKGKWWSR
jgi:hypothetical protein